MSSKSESYGALSSTNAADVRALVEKNRATELVGGKEKKVMIIALFLKGGLLGAWVPFFSLWMH